jgi:hypothetical protein
MGNRVGRARRGGPQEAGFQLLGDEDDTHVAIELGVPDEDAKDAPRRPSYGALPPGERAAILSLARDCCRARSPRPHRARAR